MALVSYSRYSQAGNRQASTHWPPGEREGPRGTRVAPPEPQAAGRYRLVVDTAAAATAVHDGEDHDGHKSSQRGPDPEGSGREWHYETPFTRE